MKIFANNMEHLVKEASEAHSKEAGKVIQE